MSKLDKLLSKAKKLKTIDMEGKRYIECLDGFVLVNYNKLTVKLVNNIPKDVDYSYKPCYRSSLSFKEYSKYSKVPIRLHVTFKDDEEGINYYKHYRKIYNKYFNSKDELREEYKKRGLSNSDIKGSQPETMIDFSNITDAGMDSIGIICD